MDVMENRGIFPHNTPLERKYWLLGVCFSRITYCGQKRQGRLVLYPLLTSDSDIYFVKQIHKLLDISTDIRTIPPRKTGHLTQYCFSFPQSDEDYTAFFLGMGIVQNKRNRQFPVLEGNLARHFFRGYVEAQCGISAPTSARLDKITALKSIIVSVHFANRGMAEAFRDFLFNRSIGRVSQLENVTRPLSVYSLRKGGTFEIKLRWHNMAGFYQLLYDFPKRITSRRSIRKALGECVDVARHLLYS